MNVYTPTHKSTHKQIPKTEDVSLVFFVFITTPYLSAFSVGIMPQNTMPVKPPPPAKSHKSAQTIDLFLACIMQKNKKVGK